MADQLVVELLEAGLPASGATLHHERVRHEWAGCYWTVTRASMVARSQDEGHHRWHRQRSDQGAATSPATSLSSTRADQPSASKP
jgi:hypothetical protein